MYISGLKQRGTDSVSEQWRRSQILILSAVASSSVLSSGSFLFSYSVLFFTSPEWCRFFLLHSEIINVINELYVLDVLSTLLSAAAKSYKKCIGKDYEVVRLELVMGKLCIYTYFCNQIMEITLTYICMYSTLQLWRLLQTRSPLPLLIFQMQP